tara:strand:- start:342 stop:719 length:378 start_codon:yes stop_codon:yes gene_type:complete
MIKNTIPSPEEYEKADRDMDKLFDGLDEVAALFKRRFSAVPTFNQFSILPQMDVDFRAYIFLNTDADIIEANEAGLVTEMRAFVIELLKQARPDLGSKFSVDFETDSFENIKKNYDGNYSFRLRG